MTNKWIIPLSFFVVFLLVVSCSGKTHQRKSSYTAQHKPVLNLMGFTIQAGAFKNVGNAVRLTERLTHTHGLDTTYFLASDKLFKVRFGNFSTKAMALKKAQSLVDAKVIEEFYIVQPEDYSVALRNKYGTDYLRESLVKTAKDFIGVPYLWGGTSQDDGFDCSGLTMTVYQLNGLNLPRNSKKQFDTGYSVNNNNLNKGDLVFFSEKGRSSVSHVGIYIGGNKFIHASSQGNNIRVDNLASTYFQNHYIGAKSFF
jgi:hypothetical protein